MSYRIISCERIKSEKQEMTSKRGRLPHPLDSIHFQFLSSCNKMNRLDLLLAKMKPRCHEEYQIVVAVECFCLSKLFSRSKLFTALSF